MENTTEQILPNSNYEPSYLWWYEAQFQSDFYVRRMMTPHQRLFYRALCQSAFYCSTRPYLPDDDLELMALADADSLEQWKENRASVMKKFYPVEINGQKLWAHKRLLEDWQRHLAAHQRSSEGGKKSASRRRERGLKGTSTGVEDHFESTGSNKTKLNQTETKSNQNLIQVNQTKPNSDSVRVGLVACERVGLVDSDLVSGLVSVWFQAQPDNGTQAEAHEAFTKLINSGVAASDVLAVLNWLPRANHWGKPGDGELDGPARFCSIYKNIRKTYESYRAAAQSRKGKTRSVREVEADSSAAENGSKGFEMEFDEYSEEDEPASYSSGLQMEIEDVEKL